MTALRTCLDCGLEAASEDELELFRKDKGRKHGRKNLCKACAAARSGEWKRAHRDRHLEYNRAYYAANLNKLLEYNRKYRAANLNKLLEHNRKYNANVRARAIEVYGGRCVQCDSTDELEFDHVRDDGAAHRKVEGISSMLCRIAHTGERLPDWELQLLCADCHRAKTSEHRRIAA